MKAAEIAEMSFQSPSDNSEWLKCLSSHLETMREADVMCDVMVRASDGQTFPAHACILAAGSAILKSSLIRKPSSFQYEVKLDGISGEVWQKLVQFIYSGMLDTPVTSDLLCAAEQLKIKSFLTPDKHLVDNVHNNCCTDDNTGSGLCAAEVEIQSLQTTDMECDQLIDDGSDGGGDDRNGDGDDGGNDDDEDDDTVDYNNDNNNDDMSESCDEEMKPESNNILPTIRQSPLSDDVKLENTSPKNVHCKTNGKQTTICESDSIILHRTSRQKCHTITFKRQFLCHKCPKVYSYKTAFLKHEKRHREKTTAIRKTPTVASDENKRYECGQCDKSYGSLYLLKRHNILHSDHNPHICSICSKRFSQSSVLRQHMRIHTGEKPYVCSFCGKTFVSVSSLNMHNLTHYPEKTHKCSSCSRSFSCRAYLQRHLVVHGALKAYQCSVCGKSFRDSGVLKVHQRVHTGERPLKCGVCGKSFRESSSLLSHKRRHTGEKPFACKVCGKTFTTTSHLYTHAKTHLKR